jgi:predicted small metal-binding protein
MLAGIVIVLYKAKQKEIMKNAAEHAVKDHGYKEQDIMNPEMREKIKSYMRKS